MNKLSLHALALLFAVLIAPSGYGDTKGVEKPTAEDICEEGVACDPDGEVIVVEPECPPGTTEVLEGGKLVGCGFSSPGAAPIIPITPGEGFGGNAGLGKQRPVKAKVTMAPRVKSDRKTGKELKEKTLDEVCSETRFVAKHDPKVEIPPNKRVVSADGFVKSAIVKEIRNDMYLPTWANYDNRPKSEQDGWRRFRNGLIRHEREHQARWSRFLRRLTRTLNGRKNITDSEFVELFNRENRKYRTETLKWDTDTDNGSKDIPCAPVESVK